MLLLSPADFFQNELFQIFVQVHYQGVKRFWIPIRTEVCKFFLANNKSRRLQGKSKNDIVSLTIAMERFLEASKALLVMRLCYLLHCRATKAQRGCVNAQLTR